MDHPFWIDWEYDRANADIGTTSRYGNYLTQSAASFREMWTDDPTAVEFAALAWRIATGPIMVPGLVRYHPRVIGVNLSRSTWDGGMIADVRLISPRPQAVAGAKTSGGRYYDDYRLDAWDRYDGIGEDDLARRAYLLTEVRLLWQLPPGQLPTITGVPTGEDLFHLAIKSVKALVWALNHEVGPVIDQLTD